MKSGRSQHLGKIVAAGERIKRGAAVSEYRFLAFVFCPGPISPVFRKSREIKEIDGKKERIAAVKTEKQHNGHNSGMGAAL